MPIRSAVMLRQYRHFLRPSTSHAAIHMQDLHILDFDWMSTFT